MGLRINQNIASQNAYRNLSVTDNQLSKSLEKLSSGFRINRAADDAAGLAISEGLRSQVGGMKVAVRNAQDGVSVVQTAEGALNEVHSILQRMRDLSVQAANDSNTATTRGNIATEITSLQGELSRIADSTNFNGINLLDGSTASMSFQVGAGATTTANAISVNLANSNVSTVATNLVNAGGQIFSVADSTLMGGGAQAFGTDIDGDATNDVTATVALGATGYASVQAVADALNSDTGFSANYTAVVFGEPTGGGVTGDILVQSKTGGTVDATPPSADFTAGATVTSALSVSDANEARTAIASIDTEIAYVSNARANLGAMQNRFEHTINNLNVAIENLSASESRIRDTDMAQEMMQFTRAQILSQAGTAMLAQANQAPQGVLQLLR